MSLRYKEDWEETKERFLAWWNHEYFGRCGLAVTAPLDHPPDLPPPPAAATPEQRWYDLDWISRQMDYQLGRTYFGGEAFPVWNAGYSGVSSIPALLGCPIDIDMTTGWWHPILSEEDRIDLRQVRLDPDNPPYRFTMEMLERAARESVGRAIPSIGAFGGSGDTLAALRESGQLLLDCMDRPDQVREAEDYLMDMWCEFYDCCHAIVRDAAAGSTCYFQLWSPGKFYGIHNDFSYNIGPDMFRDLFLPALHKQTEFLDHAVYHVDGINAFRHVDALCELPRLQALQILPGAGKPGPLHYMDTLEKVQAAGKNLHITIPADQVETALRALSARGLFIQTSTASEDEARTLLEKAAQWSVDR